MNILIVCPRLCHGGAERVAVCLANGFVDRGHNVKFMADLFEEQTYTLDNRVKLVNLISTNDSKKNGEDPSRKLEKNLYDTEHTNNRWENYLENIIKK